MNSEKISESIGELDEKIVSPAAERRAECYKEKKAGENRGRKIRLSVASAAACLGIVGGIFAMSRGDGIFVSASAETLAKAVYPEAAPYPDESQYSGVPGEFDLGGFNQAYEPWWEQKSARRDAARSLSGLSAFYQSTVPAFLSGSGSENRVYSPISLYSALSMLAETTDGESREQILALLNMENIEALREQAKNLWAANYRNDGATTTILANSVWLNQGVDFVRETVDRLAGDYYASSYRGDPVSEEMNRLLRDWLNEQTGGLLEEAVKNTELSPETVMALYSTVYFRAKWDWEFESVNNDEKIFHGVSGDVAAEFMNRTDVDTYYWGKDYGAVNLYFADGGGMWLILPDEDKTVDDVLASGEYLEMIEKMYRYEWEDRQDLIVHFSIPKFDVSSEIKLNEELKALGVADIFDAGTADFSPLAENPEEFYVSSARHAARVVIDEQGCTAAAFTEISVEGGGGFVPPEEEVYFVLDRPFLFVITSDTGGILFAGTVNSL